MRKYLVVFLLTPLLLLAFGCSEDKSTNPPDDGNGDDDFVLQGSETIGTQGGTLTTEDFVLTVPSGALDADYTLEVYASEKEKPFGSDCITEGFRLEGLPNDFSEPLELSVKYAGTAGENVAIGIGEEMYSPGSDDTQLVYHFVEAEKADGFLTCNLPSSGRAVANRGAANPTTKPRYYTGVHNQRPYARSENFVIWMSTAQSQHLDQLVTILETERDIFVGAFGSDFLGYDSSKPLEVVFHNGNWYEPEVAAYFLNYPTWTRPFLHIKPSALSNPTQFDVHALVGMELVRVAQYPEMLASLNYAADPGYYWLHDAVAQWSEELFTTDPAFTYPFGLYYNLGGPFKGLQAGAGSGFAEGQFHASGVTPVIKYLTNDPSFGTQGVAQIYSKMEQGFTSIGALDNMIPAPFETWWPEFIRQYLSSELYPIEPDEFLQLESGRWEILSRSDEPAEFLSEEAGVGPYPDLSAKMFTVDISNVDFEENDAIKFIATSPDLASEEYTIVLFAWKPGELVYQAHAKEIQLVEIPTLTGAGFTELVAVVVNSQGELPYTESSDIDLRIELTAPEQITRAEVWLKVLCRVEVVWSDGTVFEEDRDIIMGTFGVDLEQTGPDTFEATWDEIGSAGEVDQGSIRIVLDPSRDMITQLEVDYHYAYDPVDADRIERATVQNIGRYDDYYEISGTEVYPDHLTSLTYISVIGEGSQTALSPLVSEYHKITVRLY